MLNDFNIDFLKIPSRDYTAGCNQEVKFASTQFKYNTLGIRNPDNFDCVRWTVTVCKYQVFIVKQGWAVQLQGHTHL